MTADTDVEQAKNLKEEGNKYFKDGNYSEALACYTKALKLTTQNNAESAVYLKNRAACYLKQEKYTEALRDCTAALEIVPNDPKALFRRCQAYEALEKYEEAYKDAITLMKVDPKNKAIQPILARLNPIIQDKMDKQMSTESQVNQMFEIAFSNMTDDAEKREQAANNLIVLAREEAGAKKIIENGGIEKISFLLDTEKSKALKLTAIRIMACLARDNKSRAQQVLDGMSLKKICAYIGHEDEEISTAMAHVLQTIINAVTGLEKLKKERDAYEDERKANPSAKMRPFPFLSEKIDGLDMVVVDTIFKALVSMINNAKVSSYGRDNVLELFIKFISRKDGVGWHVNFIEAGGIQNVLETAGTIPEHKLIPVTTNTRMHASLLLSKVWDSLSTDQEREKFRNAVDTFFADLLSDNIIDSKVEAVLALAALLQGPSEIGNSILGRPGMLELILALADSGNAIHTKYAVEALVHSASKKDKCSGLIKQATPILKELYQSQNDYIKVRALVGLCKLGSYGGQDASSKSFAEGSTLTLSKACRKFLCNPTKDVDMRKWAAEGLAYLTLDADVKEELVEDTEALKSLFDLAQVPDKGTVYPCAQILVNVTNSYDTPEPEPEMVELAKFAKHHIPEKHEKDADNYAEERVKKVVKAGVVNALVALAKTESDSTRELIARVFLAVVKDKEHRGLVVQQGGAKALIPLALQNTEQGKIKAAQALAKIAITTNPEIAFPGQRMCEVVRPLVQLLHQERKAIENYEALMALTNLASISDTVRKRIIKEKGISMIDFYMFEEHEDLRRAAVECMCNMIMCEEVRKRFHGENDRLKLLFLLCGEEDIALVRAASGAVAMLTADLDKELCHKLTTCTTQWLDILQLLASHVLPDIQHRGVSIIRNMMTSDKEIAAKLVSTTMFELLMALSKLEEPARQQAKICAEEALNAAVEFELIKPYKT